MGSTCISCPNGTACNGGKCLPSMQVAVGSACNADADCSSIDPQAICRKVTVPGNWPYPNGYCTVRCQGGGGGGGNACPQGSVCASAPGYLENQRICLQTCGAGIGCRMGYACYAFGTGSSACWIYPPPPMFVDGGVPDAGLDAGTSLDGGRPDAGAGLPTGSACTTSAQCQPPSQAFCLPGSVGGISTGYQGGYCTQSCGPGQACTNGGLCVSETTGTTTTTSCKAWCFNPGGGQDVCRTGYVCNRVSAGSTLGWCGPRCNNSALGCPQGQTCNAMTGYCQ